MLHVVLGLRASNIARAGSLAAVAATACVLLGSPVSADVTKRPLKPTLSATEPHDVSAGTMRSRAATTAATDTESRVVSFATREMDIKKLDAAAFGDGEDVVR